MRKTTLFGPPLAAAGITRIALASLIVGVAVSTLSCASAAVAPEADSEELRPWRVDLPPAEVVGAFGEILAGSKAWKVRGLDPEIGEARLVAYTAGLRFPDEVVVRVEPLGAGAAIVRARSRSRFGTYEIAQNRRNLRDLSRFIADYYDARGVANGPYSLPAPATRVGRLDQAISMSLAGAAARDVFGGFAEILEAELELDPALESGQVTIELADRSVRDSLDSVCEALACRWSLGPEGEGPAAVLAVTPR